MENLVRELGSAVRRLSRSPGFSLVALATLALAIGANTALFSVVHAVLLRALPFKEPEHLYWLWTRHTSTDRYPFQLPEFCDYRDQNRTLAGLAGFANWSANLTGDGPAERLSGLRVGGNFFELLGAAPALGRALAPADDTPGNEKVVVLSFGLWQRRFGGDPAVLGRSVALNGESFTVVGVLDRSFLFPIRDVELAIPLAPEKDPWRWNRESTNFIRAIGRARPGVGAARIGEDFDAIARRLQQEFPRSYGRKRGILVVPFGKELTRSFRQALFVLLWAVALLLLIACANLANLMLVRATQRRHEAAVRQALGASPAQLARPLLIEGALLALGGAGCGVVLAGWAVPLLVAASPAAMPRAREIDISLPVLLFTLGVAALALLMFALAPALRAARLDPNPDLKSEGRSGAPRAGRSRAGGLIVAAQVAVMMVLLTGAGLLLQSFRELLRVEPGFDPGVLTVRLSLPRKAYPDLGRVSQLYRSLEARFATLPGVLSVAAVSQLPLNGALASVDYKVADRPPAAQDQLPTAQYRMVTPAYFRTMGLRLVAGRAFTDDDREGGAPVAIVSQALARQSFPDRDPTGEHLLVDDNTSGFRSLEIVGVVSDVKHASLEDAPEPHLYVAYHQTHPDLVVWLAQNQFLVVRTAGEPLALAAAVRREVAAVDPNVASADIRKTGYYLEAAASARRFSLTLLGLFSGIALLLASLGIYGLVSHSVVERTRETGLRLALGASMGQILALVLADGMKRTGLGIVAGLGAALAASRALRGLLYEVGATDPPTYGGVIVVLVVVTLAASFLPAWRAARSSPLVALRRD